jgi:hypothetical protein
MRRLSGETGVYALVALLGCVCVLVSLDPTGQLAGTPLGVFDGPGLTLDEGFNVDVGVRLADSVLSGDLAEYARRTGELPDHPPLGRLWLGIAHELALLVVPVKGVDAPYVIGLARTGSAVAFGLTLFLVGVTARRLATRLWPSVAEDGQPSPWERGSWGTSFLAGLAAMLALGTLRSTARRRETRVPAWLGLADQGTGRAAGPGARHLAGGAGGVLVNGPLAIRGPSFESTRNAASQSA